MTQKDSLTGSRPFDKYEKLGAYHWSAGGQDPLYVGHVSIIIKFFSYAAGLYTGKSVLDIGCGDGFIAKQLTDLGLHVRAIDTNAQALALAQEKFANLDTKGEITFECMNVFDLKEAPEFILASDVLEHFYEPDRFVAHLKVLDPTLVLISTPQKRADGRLWDPDYHVAEYGKDQLLSFFTNWLSDYGLTYLVRPQNHEYQTQYIILEKRKALLKALLKNLHLFKQEQLEKKGRFKQKH